MRKKRLKNWVKVYIVSILIVFVSLFFFTSIVLYYRAVNPKEHRGNIELSYNSEDHLTYKIKTKENNYHKDEDISMNRQYASSIIDQIIFDINYKYSASKALDYEYTYSVVANLIAEKENAVVDNELWNKEFILEPLTTIKLENDTAIDLDRTIKIDFQTYNNLMKSYVSQVGVNAKAYLKLTFYLELKSTNSYIDPIETDDKIVVTVPLLGDTTYVSYVKSGIKNENIYARLNADEENSAIFIFIYSVGVIISLILDILLFVILIELTEKDRYDYDLNKIMYKYEKILVKVDDIPDYYDLKEIHINNFKDLYDVSRELSLPILFFEEKTLVNFYIVSDTCCYMYVIKRNKMIK